MDRHSGCNPAEYIVSFDKADENEEDGGGNYDCSQERTLFLVFPVLGVVPYVLEFAHPLFSLCAKITIFAYYKQ